MQDAWSRRFRAVSGEASLASFRSGQIAAGLETFAYTLTVLAGLITLYLGVSAVLAGSMTAGALVACMMLTWRVLAPLSMLCTSLPPRIEQLYQTIGQVNRLMDLPVETDRPASDRLDNVIGRLQFTNVGLRYQASCDPLFSGLSFSARPGEVIAVTGHTAPASRACSSSPTGLYPAQAGSIRIDGMDIRQFHPVALRRRIAYVPQHPDFFTGTIAENLRIADPLASDEALLDALSLAGAREGSRGAAEGARNPAERRRRVRRPAGEPGAPPQPRARLPVGRADRAVRRAALHAARRRHPQRFLPQAARALAQEPHRHQWCRTAPTTSFWPDRAIGLRAGFAPAIGKPNDILRLIKGADHDGHHSTRH